MTFDLYVHVIEMDNEPSNLKSPFFPSSPGKHGCPPEVCVDLGHYVVEECPHLKLCGLMTIGRQNQTISPNPDFMVCIRACVLVCVCVHMCVCSSHVSVASLVCSCTLLLVITLLYILTSTMILVSCIDMVKGHQPIPRAWEQLHDCVYTHPVLCLT